MKTPEKFICYFCGAEFSAVLVNGDSDKPMCLNCVTAEIQLSKFIKKEDSNGIS